MQDIVYKSLGITYVRYVKGDIIGKLLALFTLSPIFIVVMYTTLLFFRRDLDTFFIFFFQVLHNFISVNK